MDRQTNSKKAMCGKGLDRHLFALYVVSRGIGREAHVLSKALSMPWELSTSQLPQRQTPAGTWPPYTDDNLKYLSPSGGFGPVSDKVRRAGRQVGILLVIQLGFGDFVCFFCVWCSRWRC